MDIVTTANALRSFSLTSTLGPLITAASIFVWLFAAFRIYRDERLHRQAQQALALSAVIAPILSIVYWISLLTSRRPFWVRPL